MTWFSPTDSYCERTGPEYWSEPVNAVTNLGFLIAAAVIWPRLKGRDMAMGRALAAVLFLIGIGSWLFHTHANRLTGVADVLPILAFILLYVFAATRDYFGVRPWVAVLVTAGFVPYAALTVPIFAMIPGLGSSAGYAPVPLLILIYALLLRRRLPDTARGLAIGAGILIVSLTFRTLDQPLCDTLPVGTHFLWHLLNALMLAWMIEVWRRHRLA
ncbi:ceramidase domain-containing protein [Paracoccus benzoatiresistens]|uniref:Ceramidase domain-containing protein n=1 Tax=Paracoccus benzoatiresistens TaxID=2997341 RepID=A0ABT4J2E6_9RHOB|nr:ceramidase domain-containing protein [Paracoccus sp. EF6]MCZ0961059.1 ceramidase domain-containing protein [Paracoccus sp. EF6]